MGAATLVTLLWLGVGGVAAAEGLSGRWRAVDTVTNRAPTPPGYTTIHSDLDPVVTAHLKPWALARNVSTDIVADDPGSVCMYRGFFRSYSAVLSVDIVETNEVVYFITPGSTGIRRVYLTDKHPLNLKDTWNGHSIGHWEGDTLVVDTVGFNDRSWLMSNGQPHTSDLHVTERIRHLADVGGLEIVTTVEDRQALEHGYVYSRYLMPITEEYVEDVCNGDPGEPQRYDRRRRAAIAAQKEQHRILTPAESKVVMEGREAQ